MAKVCAAGVCAAASCTDGVLNGAETDTDCGGKACYPCGAGKKCGGAADCGGAVCTAGVCAAASCTDGVLNGSETDTDCGGAACKACKSGGKCKAALDCSSAVCTGGVCVAASCADGVKNGAESDVDCGAKVSGCNPCAAGKACASAADCASDICTLQICATANCVDGIKNGAETDVDCGGLTCNACKAGKKCNVSADCKPNSCIKGSCTVASSCAAILTVDSKAPSGQYTITPSGGSPTKVQCEMSQSGGGWTLLTNHQASAGFFGNLTKALANNTSDPKSGLYSILGQATRFVSGGGYTFLYWNRQYKRYLVSFQTSSPFDKSLAGKCAKGWKVLSGNYTPSLFCGYTPGPASWSAINGYGPNWTHSVGQFKTYGSWPLVCTHNSGYTCNHIQFYVR